MYSEKLLDHFRDPRNVGELDGATAVVEVSNPVCGDMLRLAVIADGGVVREARFLCSGCTASIATASRLTELIKGKAQEELNELTPEQIAVEVGGLPPAAFHAAQLARDAVRAVAAKIPAVGC